MKVYIVFCIFSTVFLTYASKIPDFIIPCRKSDANLNECALKNARIAIPGIVNGSDLTRNNYTCMFDSGSRAYGLPNMIPLHISKIDIQAGSNLKIELSDNEVHGLENTWVYDVDMQLSKKHMVFKVRIPKANIIGQYKMRGQILILPIEGEGPANLTLMDGNYVYSMDYVLKRRHQKDYLSITNHNITFTTKRAYYYFDHLFHGDPSLGTQMNKFLDENWSEVTRDLGSTVAETISSIITSIANALFTKIPIDELLPA